MSNLQPLNTTVGDLISAALSESGAFSIGQTPSAEDSTHAWMILQMMLQQWSVERYKIYHLVTLLCTSTGQTTGYTVGPGGQFDTGANTGIAPNLVANSIRPDKVESAFLRQPGSQNGSNLNIDYPLDELFSLEDYNMIALKQLISFSGAYYYDPAYSTTNGLGALYLYPVPTAAIYAIGITVKEQLPVQFPTLATKINLPFNYYLAIVYNLAVRLRPRYGMGTWQGDELPGLAKGSLSILRGANTQIRRLRTPRELLRPGLYNIFSDRSY